MILGKTDSGESLHVDLEVLLKTRLLVTASSGGGKTGALYALCEKFSGKVQIIVIDPEGEFPPLRKKHPFLLVGPDGETPAMVRTAKLLAHRLLELNVSAICDIYELPVHQRHEFVRDFLDAMVEAPKALWHPVLVIVDEAHVYGPEKGQGESIALEAMTNMASRGRKRGYALVAATQRLAKLSKNIASELQNQLVGRTTQVDQARAGDVLNLSKGASRDEFNRMIGHMPTGDFIAYGMAFGVDEPTRFTVQRPVTLPEGKERSIVAPPAPQQVKALLPKIADLPTEVEKKQKTEEDLRKEIRELKQQLAAKPKPIVAAGITPEREKMLLDKIVELHGIGKRYETTFAVIAKNVGKIAEAGAAIQAEIANLAGVKVTDALVPSITKNISRAALETIPGGRQRIMAQPPQERLEPPSPSDGERLPGPEQKILDSILWFEKIGIEQPDGVAVAFMAGYSAGSSSFRNPRGKLGSLGLIVVTDGWIALTEEGRRRANDPNVELTNESLQRAVLNKLPGPEGKLLTALIGAHPRGMSNEELAEAAGYAVASSSFRNPRGRITGLGLAEFRGQSLYARDILFPEG